MPAKQWEERIEHQWKHKDEAEVAEHVIEFTPAKRPIVEFGPLPNTKKLVEEMYVHPKVNPPVVVREEGPLDEEGMVAREIDWITHKGQPLAASPAAVVNKRGQMIRPAVQQSVTAQHVPPSHLRLMPRPQKSKSDLHLNINVNTQDIDEEATNLILLEKGNVTFWRACSAVGIVSALALLSALGLMYWHNRRHRRDNNEVTSARAIETQADRTLQVQQITTDNRLLDPSSSSHCPRCGRLKRPAVNHQSNWRRYPNGQKPHDHRHNHRTCICAAPHYQQHQQHYKDQHSLPRYHTCHDESLNRPPQTRRRSFSQNTAISTTTDSTLTSTEATPSVMNRRHFVRRPVWEV